MNCLHSIHNNVLLGCEDGGVRILKVEDGGHLDFQPMIFPSIGGFNSSPLSSIHTVVKGNDILCVAGSKDGTVTVFNIIEA